MRNWPAGISTSFMPSELVTTSAAAGRVTFAGVSSGGWGRLVTIAHTRGTRTLYAHLSTVAVHVGQRVQAGQRIGRVGASGRASGPHLHFEVQVRGAAVDPLPALP
jgi:murein DD-endopeptidase MepM/ murein hydrolase activator NlpD